MNDPTSKDCCAPFTVRDQNIFRRGRSRYHGMHPKKLTSSVSKQAPPVSMTSYNTTLSAPLHRDTSLLSKPQSHDQLCWEPNEDKFIRDGRLDLPEDFIPPRHGFSRKLARDGAPEQSATKYETHLPDGFVHLQDIDVVCGRGAPTLVHPGNQGYRKLIQKYEASYLFAKRIDKPVIATQIMEMMKLRGVRFVRKDRHHTGQGWVVLEEDKVYEKVCQSLREGAPELRRKLLATNTKKRAVQHLPFMETHYGDQENCIPDFYSF